ncbi:cytochrome P450 [Nocardioides marinquilinus]|uniref:Cytochrome P450 n=1 Tax=Nocardioides marinquilinus TaxID=1210400 RepID=A0ABP9PAW8_9ACTN
MSRTGPSRPDLRRPVRWGLQHGVPKLAMARAARQGDLQAQLVVGQAARGEVPHQLFDQIRAAGPLQRSRHAFVTADHEAVRATLSSPDLRAGVDLANAPGLLGRMATWAASGAPLGPLTTPSLLVTEPPDHTRMRKLVTRVFSVRAVQALRVRTEQIADELLDALAAASGRVDLVEAYCSLLPVTVIAEILGVPTDERATVRSFGNAAAPSLDLGLRWTQFREVEATLSQFDAWLTTHLERKRRDPGSDLLSALVAARDDDGTALTDAELRSTAGLVLAAGFETTVNLLGNGIALLHDHPDQLALLREDPERWPNAVEEVLRLDPPVLLTGRTAVRDTDVLGVEVRRGSVVTALLAGANRDPKAFADPGTFDVTRPNAGDHVSFSNGRHYCLGAALARMEGEVGLRHLFDRFPDLSLEPGARRRDTRILRGWATLPATPGVASR